MNSISAPLALAVAIAFAVPVMADDEDSATFLKNAISGDIAEVKLGELAQEKGRSEAVREYGRTLVADHEKAMNEAKEVAEANNVTPPNEPAPEAQQAYDRLSRLSGEEFDREFIKLMVQDHRKHIEQFSEEARQGESSDVGDLAEKTLPTLEKHLEVAQSIEADTRG